MDQHENKIRATVRNASDGARQIYTTSGRKSIAPNEKVEVEMTEAEYRSAGTSTDLWLEITEGKLSGGGDPKVGSQAKTDAKPQGTGSVELNDADLEKMTKRDLADMIEKRDGTRPDDGLNKDALLDLAKNKPA